MGVAFSDSEIETIRTQLKARARECLMRTGVRKTSVADLVSPAGISTGAFYRFYDSKELLFFEVFVDMDAEVMDAAAEVLRTRTDLVPRERVTLALMTAFEKLEDLGYMRAWETESVYLLRKLPPKALADHQESEGTQIAALLSEYGIKACLPPDEVAEVVQRLLLSLSQLMAVDAERGRRVSEFMIRAICDGLFPDP
jgi:AcrR family transcriptional regulator